jgi:hypothetical protein
MTSGSADTSLKAELRASALVVLATKIPLLLALWLFELTTQPTGTPFAPTPPVALGALARWQAREVLLGAFTPIFQTDPFTGRPFAGMLPAAKGLYAGVSLVADAIHRPRPIAAVVATLLLLVPAIALLRGALTDATEREKRAVSLMVLVGPGMWFVSSPGTVPLLLFAFAAAFYGLERRRPMWLLLGAILAPLTDPAGLLVVPACLAAPGDKRPWSMLAAVAGAAGLAGFVGFCLQDKLHASVAFEPLRTWMSWPGGQLGQLSQMFGTDPRRPLMIHAFVAALFVLGGIVVGYPRLSGWQRVFAAFAMLLVLRDPSSAPSIAVWCIPSAVGWARALDRVTPAHWLSPLVMTGVFPVFLFAYANVWDFLDFGFNSLAGEAAAGAQRVPGLGFPTEPATALMGRSGRRQRFDSGVLYCTPAFGCHAIEGLPYARFTDVGGLATCGAPKSDREKVGEIWTYSFEHGTVRSQPGVFTEAICGDRKASSTP